MGFLAALNPLGAISSLIVGSKAINMTREELDKWYAFTCSLYGTQFVTFTGTWGGGIWTHFTVGHASILASLVLGFADALIATASVTYLLWLRSPLTRGMPLMVPSALAEKATQIDTTYTERPK